MRKAGLQRSRGQGARDERRISVSVSLHRRVRYP